MATTTTATPKTIVIRMGSFSYHVATYIETIDGVPVYRCEGGPSLDSKDKAVESARSQAVR